jgi:lauroyl/myristoyl acyltransferase
MEPTDLTELSDQELLEEAKKQKQKVIVFRVFICVWMVAAIYNATHKGSVLVAFVPLIFIPIFGKVENDYKAIKSEMASRQSQ